MATLRHANTGSFFIYRRGTCSCFTLASPPFRPTMWLKEIAPSTALRKWFGHDPARWQEFQHRYQSEVRQHPGAFERLRALARRGRITLVYSAHDEAHNDAVVLKDLLLERA
jgi:uncharacterized protein YeaO (DUF488 family)